MTSQLYLVHVPLLSGEVNVGQPRHKSVLFLLYFMNICGYRFKVLALCSSPNLARTYNMTFYALSASISPQSSTNDRLSNRRNPLRHLPSGVVNVNRIKKMLAGELVEIFSIQSR